MAEIFETALADLRQKLPKAQTILVLYGEEEEMPVQACHGLLADQVWSTAPLSLSVLRKVRSTGEPVFLTGSQTDPDLCDVTSLVVAGIRAVLCVPVRDATREVRGLLYVDQRLRQDFDRTDLFKVIQVGRDLERKLEGHQTWRDAPKPRLPAAAVRKQAASPAKDLPPLKLPSRSRVLLLRGLATMVAAGISIGRALSFLAQQSEEPGLSQVSQRLVGEVEKGRPLSQAMASCGPGCFGDFILRLVRVGEETGLLADVLRDLASHEERSRALVMRLRSQLTYPLVLFVCCLAMLVILPPLALKGPLKAITDIGEETPWLTRTVVGVASALSSPTGILAVIGVIVISLEALRRLRRRPGGRLWLQRRLLALGPLGHGLRLLAVTRFSISLALLLRSGVGILKALPSALASADDAVLESLQPAMMERLSGGADLAETLDRSGFFPKTFIAVLTSGEQTGRLDRTLPWIAGMYELELESALEMACAALEPLLMLGMGVTAALIALAVMLPLVKLTQSL